MIAPLFMIATAEAPPPIGPVHLVSDGNHLVTLDVGAPEARLLPLLRARFGPAARVTEVDDPQGFAAAVRAYLAETIDALNHSPADGGGTPFQRRVWGQLRAIPPGGNPQLRGAGVRTRPNPAPRARWASPTAATRSTSWCPAIG